MKLSRAGTIKKLEVDLGMLAKAFRLLAVAFAKSAGTDAAEAGVHAAIAAIVADLRMIEDKLPHRVGLDNPLIDNARFFQRLHDETRDDIAQALRPH